MIHHNSDLFLGNYNIIPEHNQGQINVFNLI